MEIREWFQLQIMSAATKPTGWKVDSINLSYTTMKKLWRNTEVCKLKFSAVLCHGFTEGWQHKAAEDLREQHVIKIGQKEECSFLLFQNQKINKSWLGSNFTPCCQPLHYKLFQTYVALSFYDLFPVKSHFYYLGNYNICTVYTHVTQ